MAPTRAAAPRTKRAPQNLSNIGVEGRATGLTVDERPRDENGLEILESWYSSPAPLVGRRNGTSNSSEDMEVAQSSGPDPTEVMTSGKLARSKRKSAVVPRGRSPIKTSLGATPLRGTPRTSTSAIQPQTHEKLPVKSPRRLLDFSQGEVSRSVERSGPRISQSRQNGTPQTNTNGDIFALPQSPESNPSPPSISDLPEEDAQMIDVGDDLQEEDSPLPPIGEDGLDDEQDNRLEDGQDDSQENEQELMDDNQPGADDPQGQAASEVSDEAQTEEEQGAEDERQQGAEDEQEQEPTPVKRRGRPRKNPLAEKDVNKTMQPPPRRSPGAKSVSRMHSTASRPTQRQRTQTPMEETGGLRTRFGRNTYKPLAYWKGERAVYQEHTLGQDLREIVRIEDATPPRRLPRQTKSKKRDYTVFEEEQEQDYEEAWEVSEGVVNAPVRMWDSELGLAPSEDEVEQQLAFASARIQPRASPDNPNFFFIKTLQMPFFGSGVIEIPAGGYKGLKNARKFQFIFFVHYGKVNVEVAGAGFTITKGGMWQVPRGNFYSITNDTDHAAKIFFAQSCEIIMDPAASVAAAAAPALENLNG